jgi:hypothetical protein
MRMLRWAGFGATTITGMRPALRLLVDGKLRSEWA